MYIPHYLQQLSYPTSTLNTRDTSQPLAGDYRDEQTYRLVAIMLGCIAYGIYLVLLTIAIPPMLERARQRSSWIFLNGNLALFGLASGHILLMMYRASLAFGREVMSPRPPISMFKRFGTWDVLLSVVLLDLGVWTADFLVIYRCFLIWDQSRTTIALPALLLLLSISIGGAHIAYYIAPSTVPGPVVAAFFLMVYPINLAQNTMTTGLIAFKIWRQHRLAVKANLHSYQGGAVPLLSVARIIIESAAIYTVQQLVLLVLSAKKHPAEVLVFYTVLPSIGIVFILMAIRTYNTKELAPPSQVVILGLGDSLGFGPDSSGVSSPETQGEDVGSPERLVVDEGSTVIALVPETEDAGECDGDRPGCRGTHFSRDPNDTTGRRDL
ncbi:hypothetical protein FA15DRAFT_692888 [Coprinopsis marcescibilis]|uniref:Uncharacterized protein n=1 Tax=Coprinopsis marcescibilis TaxID=230819 RepID=A0A5C3LEK1_COPMA|nr:hypothetical protein FA15DRAFT_692888 [Coprinopsis marcescibilis]